MSIMKICIIYSISVPVLIYFLMRCVTTVVSRATMSMLHDSVANCFGELGADSIKGFGGWIRKKFSSGKRQHKSGNSGNGACNAPEPEPPHTQPARDLPDKGRSAVRNGSNDRDNKNDSTVPAVQPVRQKDREDTSGADHRDVAFSFRLYRDGTSDFEISNR